MVTAGEDTPDIRLSIVVSVIRSGRRNAKERMKVHAYRDWRQARAISFVCICSDEQK